MILTPGQQQFSTMTRNGLINTAWAYDNGAVAAKAVSELLLPKSHAEQVRLANEIVCDMVTNQQLHQ